jgi:hypothetical protein
MKRAGLEERNPKAFQGTSREQVLQSDEFEARAFAGDCPIERFAPLIEFLYRVWLLTGGRR